MSLKLIELQVAIPKTTEAGKITEQLQQRGQVIADQAKEEFKEKVEQDRQKVNLLQESDKVGLKKDNDPSKEKREQHSDPKEQAKMKEKETSQDQHPYKGKRIDYSG